MSKVKVGGGFAPQGKDDKATEDETQRVPGDALTEQNQQEDMGPRAGGDLPVGQHNDRGRPPLMKK